MQFQSINVHNIGVQFFSSIYSIVVAKEGIELEINSSADLLLAKVYMAVTCFSIWPAFPKIIEKKYECWDTFLQHISDAGCWWNNGSLVAN